MRFAGPPIGQGTGSESARSCNPGCRKRVALEPPHDVTAVILNLTSFGLATLCLVAVTLLHLAPTRPCHRCGYEFEPIRFGN
jgi:hypothetical protein